MGLQSPDIKQITVKAVTDVYCILIVKVLCGLLELYAEEDAEQSWCQDTTLFNAADYGKGFRKVAVQPDLASLVFMQLGDHTEELWGTPEVFHDHPQSFPAHCVERFGQVYICDLQSSVLFPTLLLELPEDEHHVCGASIGFKATLGFREVVFSDGRYQSVQEHSSEDFFLR